jgi:hypothetical protein
MFKKEFHCKERPDSTREKLVVCFNCDSVMIVSDIDYFVTETDTPPE